MGGLKWASALVGATAVVVAVGVPSASADSGPAALAYLTTVDRATRAAAATGIDVVQIVRFSRRSDLALTMEPTVRGTVPAGAKVRVHVTVNPDAAFYMSVRRQPGSRLIGSTGRETATALPWATVSMLYPAPAARARRAGATERTAITGILNADAIADYWVVNEPIQTALRMILPPYSGDQEEGWRTVDTSLRADGTTLISGTIAARPAASDGEDNCVRPLVEIVVGASGLAQSSHWREMCPGEGTREYWTTMTYGVQSIQPPTNPQMTWVRAFGG